MWKPNLNRHFSKIYPALKISLFALIWNTVFHSLTLSILVYWSLTSARVPELNRMSTLNQFWSENQIIFATMSIVTGAFFFQNELKNLLKIDLSWFRVFGRNFLRGCFFCSLLMIGLILNHRYEFLGFSAQLNLNFLSSYSWLFRAFLILTFVLSSEFLIRVVLHEEARTIPDSKVRFGFEAITYLMIYWIWFSPSWKEMFSLALLFSLFSSFWSSSGFISALFIMTHAVFGLPFFENEFVGIFQLKPTKLDETFLQNPFVVVTLLILVCTLRIGQYIVLKSKGKEFSTS